MTEQVLSRTSGIDGLLCQGNHREAEACSRIRVTGIEIQLNEVNDLADKWDRRPLVRDSLSTVNTSTIYMCKGVRRRDVTGGRVISVRISYSTEYVSTSSVHEGVKRGDVTGGRVTLTEFVDRRSVCGDRALATKGTRDQEDYGGGSQHSNLQKHQNAFGIPLISYSASRALVLFTRRAKGRCNDQVQGVFQAVPLNLLLRRMPHAAKSNTVFLTSNERWARTLLGDVKSENNRHMAQSASSAVSVFLLPSLQEMSTACVLITQCSRMESMFSTSGSVAETTIGSARQAMPLLAVPLRQARRTGPH